MDLRVIEIEEPAFNELELAILAMDDEEFDAFASDAARAASIADLDEPTAAKVRPHPRIPSVRERPGSRPAVSDHPAAA